MQALQPGHCPSRFWLNWLQIALAAMMLGSLLPLLAPATMRDLMSLLVFGDPSRIRAFETAAVHHVDFVHAVLGAVMFAWSLALLCVVREQIARGERRGWRTAALSLVAWFVPGTVYSALHGVGWNVLVNVACAVVFGLPVAQLYRACHPR